MLVALIFSLYSRINVVYQVNSFSGVSCVCINYAHKTHETDEKEKPDFRFPCWLLRTRGALPETHPFSAVYIYQRAEKQRAQEEDRRIRLERLRSENDEEVGKIRTDATESLSKAEQDWETERSEMERELTEKVRKKTLCVSNADKQGLRDCWMTLWRLHATQHNNYVDDVTASNNRGRFISLK